MSQLKDGKNKFKKKGKIKALRESVYKKKTKKKKEIEGINGWYRSNCVWRSEIRKWKSDEALRSNIAVKESKI